LKIHYWSHDLQPFKNNTAYFRDTLYPKFLSGELSVGALKITNEQGEATNE
jgi:hypothetical protein